MMSRKQRYFDSILAFIFIVGGVCFGGISFGANDWFGTVILILIGAVLFSLGIAHIFIRGLHNHVDDSEE